MHRKTRVGILGELITYQEFIKKGIKPIWVRQDSTLVGEGYKLPDFILPNGKFVEVKTRATERGYGDFTLNNSADFYSLVILDSDLSLVRYFFIPKEYLTFNYGVAYLSLKNNSKSSIKLKDFEGRITL